MTHTYAGNVPIGGLDPVDRVSGLGKEGVPLNCIARLAELKDESSSLTTPWIG